MGAGRLRLRSGGFTRRRPLARLPRHLVGPRDEGPLPLRRVGSRAAVEHRQDRLERHLLLRDEPVAGRGAPAPPPRRPLHLGGGRPLLSRPQPSPRASLPPPPGPGSLPRPPGAGPPPEP